MSHSRKTMSHFVKMGVVDYNDINFGCKGMFFLQKNTYFEGLNAVFDQFYSILTRNTCFLRVVLMPLILYQQTIAVRERIGATMLREREHDYHGSVA